MYSHKHNLKIDYLIFFCYIEACEIIETESPELEVEDMEMVDQVLELNETGLEQALVTQAHLLEETDINNVLNTIQVDEFSDLFTGMLIITIEVCVCVCGKVWYT